MQAPVYNPSVPYRSQGPQGFFAPGKSVRIQGRTYPSPTSFAITFKSSNGDIPLYIHTKFDQSIVVRNAKSFGTWGHEERHGYFPFVKGQPFDIIVLCEARRYMIAVNGQHFTEFQQRLGPETVTGFEVDGDVNLTMIHFDSGMGRPNDCVPSAPPMMHHEPYQTAPPPPMAGAGIPPSSTGAPPYPMTPIGFVTPTAASALPAAPYPPVSGYAQPPGGYAPGGLPYPAQPPSYAQVFSPPSGPYPPTSQAQGYPGYPPQTTAPYPYAAPYPPPSQVPGQSTSSSSKSTSGINKSGVGAVLGGAAAAGVAAVVARKVLTKGKGKKLLKFGVPLAAAGAGGYMVNKKLEKRKSK